jgi:hypothetical protein
MSDPSQFIAALLGSFLATLPAQAGVVCNRQGFCVAQPQFQQPYYPPPPPVIIKQSPPQEPQPQDAEGFAVKQEILAFCQQHPDEHFCTRLEVYLQKHPDAR